MGASRKFSPHVRWSASELELLREHYPKSTKDVLLSALRGRTLRIIACKANDLGLVRPKLTKVEILRRKRDGMARLRARDPEAARAKRNAFHARNRVDQVAKMRDYYARRFFWGRAMKLRGEGRATYRELAALWKVQRGRCALTGRRLDRTAQLDHIEPKARGGTDRRSNLRWVTRAVNLAKRDLTDAEFFGLCRIVVQYHSLPGKAER